MKSTEEGKPTHHMLQHTPLLWVFNNISIFGGSSSGQNNFALGLFKRKSVPVWIVSGPSCGCVAWCGWVPRQRPGPSPWSGPPLARGQTTPAPSATLPPPAATGSSPAPARWHTARQRGKKEGHINIRLTSLSNTLKGYIFLHNLPREQLSELKT